MVNSIMVNMLVRKIQAGEINPSTGQAFRLEDIKLQEYKSEVEKILNQQVSQ